FRAAILLAGYAGLRASEIGGLRASDVNFLRNRLTVQQMVRTVNGAPELVKHLKTTAGRRSLGIPSFLTEELSEHVRLFPPGEDGLLFHAREGGLASHLTLNKEL